MITLYTMMIVFQIVKNAHTLDPKPLNGTQCQNKLKSLVGMHH